MLHDIVVNSHKGDYKVHFNQNLLLEINQLVKENRHFIIDKHVANLYRDELAGILNFPSVMLIDATEESKSLHHFSRYVEQLVDQKIRRDHIICAIGGGIIQDITCFISSTILRGVEWEFIPTTLLAQADSCIGSKSSINVNGIKNILGNFYPPKQIILCTKFLKTLKKADLMSGVGEILKVHIIDGPESYDKVSDDYDFLFEDSSILEKYIQRSLLIKKSYIERDEFDQGIRRIFNYGHSFGHAIESATNFRIPHGIAVSIGMDMANYVSSKMNILNNKDFHRMHFAIGKNYSHFNKEYIDMDTFISSISKDKKNLGQDLTLILPSSDLQLEIVKVKNDGYFRNLCENYFQEIFYSS